MQSYSIDSDKLVDILFKEQDGFYDNFYKNTNTRVYSLLRIIRSNNLMFVLEYISHARNANFKTINKAKELIKEIKIGKLKVKEFTP